MTNRTERAVDWFLTSMFLGITGIFAGLAYKAFSSGALIFGFAMIAGAFVGIIFGAIYLREILVRRWAERKEV